MDTFRSIRNSCVAELLGTMLFVFCGTASTLVFDSEHPPSNESIGIAFGASYSVLVNMTVTSGGYLNTAVTVAMMIRRRITLIRGLCFIVVQCIGATLGSGLLYLLTPEHVRLSLGATTLGQHILPLSGVCVELVMTFLLVFTALLCTDGHQKTSDAEAALRCGLVVTGCHLYGTHFTSCGMNPARSIGPAIITGIWNKHWVYWTGPISGALIACLLHFVFNNFPVVTNADMGVTGSAIDLPEGISHQSENEDPMSDKVSQTPPGSPRFHQVSIPTEMKTYL